MLEASARLLSRRMFLAGTSAVLAGPVALGAEPPKIDGYVDAHSHVWTDDVVRYPLVDNQAFRRGGPPPPNTSGDGRPPDNRQPVEKALDHLAKTFPLKTPEWTAPSRAQASIATTASGTIGM